MTNDELRAAAAQWTHDRDDPGWLSVPPSARPLADFAAAMLDETPVDLKWIKAILGEVENVEGRYVDWFHPKSSARLTFNESGWAEGFEDGDGRGFFDTRCGVLAFFIIVKWPVDWAKVLEAANQQGAGAAGK